MKPQMDSWWVSEMSGVKVYGAYDIKFIDNGYTIRYEISNYDFHWLGWDRIDTNSEKEWGNNNIKWFIESMVGVVGDSMLGADFPIKVYANEIDFYQQKITGAFINPDTP
jgi:hypothetical protein